MAKKNKLIPKSKAKNAYDLLSEVRALILAEPKRYDQGMYLLRGQAELNEWGRKAPDCGTVACVAGWVATLKQPERLTAVNADDRAKKVLGLDWDQAAQLFSGGALIYAKARVQTLGYAREGAAHIRRFQRAWASQLKAKRV